ncbi:MAG TPA: tRNA lysidine(34) synthetase TilS [Deltaproteobacteria bacterium]|nr:tRNA lysidine(34) synthetase TilS [Deltaproteobacteria bacterium]
MSRVDLKKRLRERFQKLPAALRSAPILIAVSSGMDSSVLASVALELREILPPLHFAHVNYHLRIPDSDHEEAFLREWARRERIPIFVKSLRPQRRQGNLQAWARAERLQFFAGIVKRRFKNHGQVWLAHHQRDQAETILSRILRGAGLQGIAGMQILENYRGLSLFRPWLDVPHEAIEIYVRAHSLKFHQDKSNDSDIYLRNRIRRRVLPLLSKENPNVEEVLYILGAWSREAHEALEILGKAWLARRRGPPKELKLAALRREPRALAAVILELWLHQQTGSEQSWKEVLPRLLQAWESPLPPQEIWLKNCYRLNLQAGRLLLRRAARKNFRSS